jgi:uncharacterized Zn finger protein (UPF0148 family)
MSTYDEKVKSPLTSGTATFLTPKLKLRCAYGKNSCNKIINSWSGMCPEHEKLIDQERKQVQEKIAELKAQMISLENEFESSTVKSKKWKEEFMYRDVRVVLHATADVENASYNRAPDKVVCMSADFIFTEPDHLAFFPCDDIFLERFNLCDMTGYFYTDDEEKKEEKKEEKEEKKTTSNKVICHHFRHSSSYRDETDEDGYPVWRDEETDPLVSKSVADFRSSIQVKIDLILDAEGSNDKLTTCGRYLVGQKHLDHPLACHR